MGKLKFEAGQREEEAALKAGPQPEDRGIVAKVDEIVEQALASGASDVHVDPGPVESRVRMRAGAVLQDVGTLSSAIHAKVVNRFKILGAMDITKTKVAQSGFFKVEHEGGRADCRVFVLPSVAGEKVTVHFQAKRSLDLSLEHLGFFTEILKTFKEALAKPNGLILVAGPPSSGRTTTCYAALAHLSSNQRYLASVEAVPKYELPGLVQVAAPPQSDLFRANVDAMMESAPDVALVGEVPKPEVARRMLDGAFARCIVLGRMVAHDSASALASLTDMGIQPFLLTAGVSAILAQRLVRRVCDQCKHGYAPSEAVLAEIGYKMRPDMQFFRGKGCAACGGSGHRGRLALFELMVLNEELNELIVSRRPSQDIREAATRGGMVPLKRDGVNKAVMGYTSIEEVLNAL